MGVREVGIVGAGTMGRGIATACTAADLALEFRELEDLKYRPCPLLRKKIRAGHPGEKPCRGLFEYVTMGEFKMSASP